MIGFRKLFLLVLPVLAFVSCLPVTQTEQKPIAILESFSISSFYVSKNDINNYGRDTTVRELVLGGQYHFNIDQKRGLIYNPDSLPYGSDVSGVNITLRSQGSTSFENRGNNSDKYPYIAWSADYVFDLTHPLKVRVVSPDKSYIREYLLTVNVHKQHPDSMQWHSVQVPLLQEMTEVYSAQLGDSMVSLCYKDGYGYSVFKTDLKSKNTVYPRVTGLEGKIRTMTVFADCLFANDSEGKLYSSGNGYEWAAQNVSVKYLPVCTTRAKDDTLFWGYSDQGLLCSTNGSEWTGTQLLPAGFPKYNVSYLSYGLRTNPGLFMSVMVGYPDNVGSAATVFVRMSNQNEWNRINPTFHSTLLLPYLKNMTVFHYDGSLFACGADSQGFYQSLDNGISWRFCESYCYSYSTWNNYMQYPKTLMESDYDGISIVPDSQDNIWLIPYSGQRAYYGYINRLKY